MHGQSIGTVWCGTTTEMAPAESPLTRLWHQVRDCARVRGEPVMGASAATRAVNEALLLHLPQSLRIYANAKSIPEVNKCVANLMQRRSSQAGTISIKPFRDLESDWKNGSINAWLMPTGQLTSVIRIREAVGATPIPIVSLHHSFSYAQMLHDYFLFLLLGATYPFDALVCTSRAARRAIQSTFDHVAESVARRYRLKVRFNGTLPLIPLGVNTSLFCPRRKDVARTHFAIPRDKFVLLFLGRLSVTDKGDLLPWLAALRRLPVPARKRIEIVIAGSERPGMVKQLRGYARKVKRDLRIRVISPVSEAMKIWLYSAADVFFSPADNLQEAFGLTPLEAMACGVPQVVSDWDGYRDTVEDGTTGFLIPTLWTACDDDINRASSFEHWERGHLLLSQSVAADCEAFAQHIVLLMENESLRTRMSEASRRRAIQLYSWPTVSRQYEELLISAAQEAKSWKQQHQTIPDPGPPYWIPRYFDVYQHYASTILCGKTTVRAGNRCLTELGDGLPYEHLQELDIQQLCWIAELVQNSGEEGATMDEIVVMSTNKFVDSVSSRVLRHVMWLIKYGYLKAGKAEQGSSRSIEVAEILDVAT